MKMKTYPLLKKVDFPDGILCAECETVFIAPGQPYEEITVDKTENSITVEIICVYCV